MKKATLTTGSLIKAQIFWRENVSSYGVYEDYVRWIQDNYGLKLENGVGIFIVDDVLYTSFLLKFS